MLSLNFVVVFILFLLLFGTSNGTEVALVDGNVTHLQYNIDGFTYGMPNHDELIYYAKPGTNVEFIKFCIKVNSDTHECVEGTAMNLLEEEFFHLPHSDDQEWILKVDVIAFYPYRKRDFELDVVNYNFPVYSLYFKLEENLKVFIIVYAPHLDNLGTDSFNVYFTDPEDKCREYRPKEIKGAEMLKLNLFLNKKWTKYFYYFIKKDNFICAYSFEYEDLFLGDKRRNYTRIVGQMFPKKFELIDTYPTENYAPDFFCVDVLYGTFVSLYWNQQEPNSLPEAHYYIINEKDLKNIQSIDRQELNGFDKDVLKDIFDKNYDEKYFPTFQSYGRQIFVWFKRPSENRAFNGLWKNDTEYDTHFLDFTPGDPHFIKVENKRKIWRARKDYIQIEQPVGRESAISTPPPLQFPPAPTQAPTTAIMPPATTTTTKATTVLPITLPPLTTPNTVLTSTAMPATTTMEETASAASNTTFNDTTYFQVTPLTTSAIEKSHTESLKDECTNYIDLYLYLLNVLIVIIVFEVILLVILIILKCRGAKKMKEAMARKKSLKSKSSIKKKPSPELSNKHHEIQPTKKETKKMPWTKKSTKEKSVTTKSDGGRSAIDAKKTTTTVDQTNYYTIGETFDKSDKKKKNAK